MKKLIVIALLSMFLMSCGQAAMQSGFWQHDAVYQNWEHMRFSWFGYDNPTAEDRQMTAEQNWWGTEVPYVPGQ